MSSEKKILVTGFGPFGEQTTNASWVAVQELTRIWEDRPSRWQSYKLETREIPVAYKYIVDNLGGIYSDTSPVLSVHVGVSPDEIIMLEKYGSNQRYHIPDVNGMTHPNGIIKPGEDNQLPTRIDLEQLKSRLESLSRSVEFGISFDAGKYLCDFIYYNSLFYCSKNLATCRVLFVHVPVLKNRGGPYTSEQLGQALKDIIEIVLDVITS